MSGCLNCHGQDTGYRFRVLEVQTLHVRDFSGEKRVQALGLFQDYTICANCAQAYLNKIRRPGRTLAKRILPFVGVFLVGIVVTILCRTGDAALRLLGAAGLLCGSAGTVTALQTQRKRRMEYAAMDSGDALERAAWECLLEAAPRKDGENDLTYIPVDKKTLAMKNGDLMIAYELLPAVAKKAWELLHSTESLANSEQGLSLE